MAIFGFGSEIEVLKKFPLLIKNPITFLKKNKDRPEALADIVAFNLRIGGIISYFFDIIPRAIPYDYVYLIVFILLGRLFGIIFLYITTYVLNFFVEWFNRKYNPLAAMRTVALASFSMILLRIPYLFGFAIALFLLLQIIGVKTQYKISFEKATFVVVVNTIFYGMLLILTYFDFFGPPNTFNV